jgi:hypothetical protein
LLAHGRWFSQVTPASSSSTTKTGRHDIAESDIKHQKSNQVNQTFENRLDKFCNKTDVKYNLSLTLEPE